MKLTTRDIEIICFINDFGFCETGHIGRKFKLKEYRVNRLMKRLIQQGYVVRERLLYGRDAAYRLTTLGANFTNLPRLNKIALGSYHHNVALIDLYLIISQMYPRSIWIGERFLRQGQHSVNSNASIHCADALLLVDGKQIAIEVELSSKKQSRLEKIIKGYSSDFNTKEVWYFCRKEVLPLINKTAVGIPYIKAFNYDDFVGSDSFAFIE